MKIGIMMFPTRHPVDVANAAAVMLTSESETAALAELAQLAQQTLS